MTRHVDVSDAQARAAPPSLSECRPGRGGGEEGGRGRRGRAGEGEATRESLWAAGRTGSRGGGSQGLAEGLGGPLEGRHGCRVPSSAGLARPGARSHRRSAHPASARVSRLQLGQARSPAAAAPAPNARRPPGSPFFLPSPSSPLASPSPLLFT